MRRAGSDSAHVWDTYAAQLAANTDYGDGSADGSAPSTAAGGTVDIGARTGASVSVDSSLLVRPDGKSPADGSKLKTPAVPKSTLSNTAYLVKESAIQAGLSFKNISRPAVLRAPAATVTVTAAGTSATVPSWFQDGIESPSAGGSAATSDPATPATALAPAEGQAITAYRITVGPGWSYPDPNATSGSYGGNKAADASTSLSVGVGAQQLSIKQAATSDTYPTDNSSGSTFSIACESVPCSGSDSGGDGTTSYVLAVSAAKGQAQNLTASVNGSTFTLPLAGGVVASKVSTSDQTRSSAVQQLNATVTSHDLQIDPDNYGPTYTMSGSIPAAFLTGFDYAKGWAPAGKAWLEVPVTGADSNTTFKPSFAKSGTLSAAGKTYQADASAGAGGTYAFLVPDSLTASNFVYQPQGTITSGYPEKTRAFKLPAFSFKLNIPK